MFFWNSLAFSMIQRMLAIWSLVPLHFLNLAWKSESSRFTYCWSLAWRNLKHHFTSMWDECNCVVVSAFFGIAFFGIGMKTDLFQSCGHCRVFQICLPDLNELSYDYTVEVTNRFKGIDLIDRVPEELWTKVRDIVQEAVIKTIPKKKEM